MSASISSVRSLMIIPRSRDRAVFTLTGGSIADISDGSYEALDRDAFFFFTINRPLLRGANTGPGTKATEGPGNGT